MMTILGLVRKQLKYLLALLPVIFLFVVNNNSNCRAQAFLISDNHRSTITASIVSARTTTTTAASARTTTTTSTTTLLYNNFLFAVAGIAPSKPILYDNRSLGKSLYDDTYLQQAWDDNSIVCSYKASKDGWSATNFHNCVDGKGSGLVVALSRTGALFGGYNPSGWRSTDDYYNSNAAFLWHSKGNKAKKCPILPGGNAAIYDYATGGPCFGSSDLLIGEPKAAVMGGFAGPDMENIGTNAGSLRNGNSQFGGTYNKGDDWPIRGKFSLVDIEVYCRT